MQSTLPIVEVIERNCSPYFSSMRQILHIVGNFLIYIFSNFVSKFCKYFGEKKCYKPPGARGYFVEGIKEKCLKL